MKKVLISILLCILNSNVHANAGDMSEEFNSLNGLTPDTGNCELNGKPYLYNTRVAMNRQMLATYKYLENKKADEDLAVVMQCKYIVDPLSHDHPEQKKRKYVWVAGQ